MERSLREAPPKKPWVFQNGQYGVDIPGMETIPEDFHALFSYAHSCLPGKSEFRYKQALTAKDATFPSIRNDGSNPPNRLADRSRVTSTPVFLNESFSYGNDSEKLKLLKTLCNMEIVTMLLASMLRLENVIFNSAFDESAPKLYAPDSGPRFLSTAPNCQTQDAH